MGVLGCEGVGKTCIMNLLATYPMKEPKPFPGGSSQGDRTGHSSLGVTAYVTSDRVILLGELNDTSAV